MNPWASRRKSLIFVVFFFFLLVLIGVPSYFILQDKPNCNNHLMDGDESGVDCGGSCELLCTPETLPLISKGDPRVLKIASSTYVVTILIENPNIGGEVKRAPYNLTIYAQGNRDPIKVFNRETYVGRNSTFAIFEGPFNLSGEGPFRAVFKWGENLVWEKSNAELPMISIEGINLTTDNAGRPRLEAKLINRSPKVISNVEVVALLSDQNTNIVTSGKTFVDNLDSLETETISFSWPSQFDFDVASIRILPHVLPDKSFIK